MSLLEVEELRTGYGSLPVLQGISFAVEEGETAVMFGLNGAGKTTTVNALAGLLPVWSGDVRLDGRSLKGLDPTKIVSAGVALSPEGRRVFPALSVLTNLRLGAWTRRGAKREVEQTVEQVFQYFPRLEERKDQLAGTMSGGEQQMLAIGRALMTNPKLLILDEATEGLAPIVRQEIWSCLALLREHGLSMIVVDKNLKSLLPLANRHYIIEKGRIAWQGTSEELRGRSDVVSRYLSV